MPYGVDHMLGGDNKENDAFMEKCVSEVKATGKSEGVAIAICKVSLRRHIANMKKDMSRSAVLNSHPGIHFTIE